MSTKKPDIEQIRKYLQGELKNGAMHQLERKTQDDAFFAEAMEGFESAAPDQSANYSDLETRLAKRINRKKGRSIMLWRVLPLAACLLIALMAGYWYFTPKAPKKQLASSFAKPMETHKATPSDQMATHTDMVLPQKANVARLKRQQEVVTPAEAMAEAPPHVSANAEITVNEPVGNAEINKSYGYTAPPRVDTSMFMRKSVLTRNDSDLNRVLAGRVAGVQARINGKNYAGGNVQQATKNLPADILEKIQVVDDYGDQAAKTGVKNGDPTKVLNITTADSAHKGQLTVKEERNIAQGLTGKVAGLNVLPANQTITGTVVSKDDGQPLPGAMIRISGSNQAIRTNADGRFTITVPANSTPTLQVAYIGYLPITVNATGKDLKVQLESNQTSLAEVVVGYGTQNRKNVAASATEVNAEPIDGQKAYDNYLEKAAVMPNGETGTVRVGFTISDGGQPQNVHVISGRNKAVNEKAIQIIENGPRWKKGNTGREVRLRIRFRKAKS